MLVACHHKRLDVSVSDINVDLGVKRYDQLMFSGDASEVVNTLLEAYDRDSIFIDYYLEDILRVGDLHADGFAGELSRFVNDTVIAKVADSVRTVFQNFEPVKKELTSGFKHFRYYFPDKIVPQVYTYVSGFNQSLMVGDRFVGIGLDKYLGSDCIFYQYLGIPRYKIRNMVPGRIVPDLYYAWAMTEFPNTDRSENLLSEMIYQGKLIYFTEAMCPDLPDSVLMGYTAKQLKWCRKNEGTMWSYWAEHKLLFSVERLDLQKYVGDAPFTNTFSEDSPGRTGVWTGWQIVRSYMNKHPEVSLEMLMQSNSARELLSQSDYFPN